jgi:pilus assembly protein CpaE
MKENRELTRTEKPELSTITKRLSSGHAESLSMSALSLVLIGPDEKRRRAVAKAFAGTQATIARELSLYPAVDDLAALLQGDYDGVIVDLDANPEQAFEVIENLCSSNNSITVMVYSALSDPQMLVRCMRAGAREFLTEPVLPGSASEALVRASVRRDEVRRQRTAAGKLLVFVGPKGGSGVTTAASNFAVALAKHGKVALIDLDLQLGDVALTLGLTSSFTTFDAFENPNRLDSDFLSGLMAKHASGLAVLVAPDKIPPVQPSSDGLERLLRVAREDFAYVVVDAGSCSIEMNEMLFEMATTVYLVTQVSVADLRNANRFVTRYFSGPDGQKLEIVLNRYTPRNIEIDDDAIAKALTQPPKWRIPNDYAVVHRAQNAGVAITSEKNPIALAIAKMANAASGQLAVPEKKKKFGLFG